MYRFFLEILGRGEEPRSTSVCFDSSEAVDRPGRQVRCAQWQCYYMLELINVIA